MTNGILNVLKTKDEVAMWLDSNPDYHQGRTIKPKEGTSIKYKWVTCDGKSIQVPVDSVDFYLKRGFLLGRVKSWSTKGRVTVHLGETVKMIEKDKLEYYIERNWLPGSTRKHGINKDGVYTLVLSSALNDYLSKGWVMGTVKN